MDTKKRIRRHGAALSGAYKLTHSSLATLWEKAAATTHQPKLDDIEERKLSVPTPKTSKASSYSQDSCVSETVNFKLSKRSVVGHVDTTSALTNRLKASPSAGLHAVDNCTGQPNKPSTSIRPLGMPRNAATCNALDCTLEAGEMRQIHLPPIVLMDEPTNAAKGPAKTKMIHKPKVQILSQVSETVTKAENKAKYSMKPTDVQPKNKRDTDDSDTESFQSSSSLDECLKELQTSPYFDDYMKLMTKKTSGQRPGANQAFKFSYFNYYKKLNYHSI